MKWPLWKLLRQKLRVGLYIGSQRVTPHFTSFVLYGKYKNVKTIKIDQKMLRSLSELFFSIFFMAAAVTCYWKDCVQRRTRRTMIVLRLHLEPKYAQPKQSRLESGVGYWKWQKAYSLDLWVISVEALGCTIGHPSGPRLLWNTAAGKYAVFPSASLSD